MPKQWLHSVPRRPRKTAIDYFPATLLLHRGLSSAATRQNIIFYLVWDEIMTRSFYFIKTKIVFGIVVANIPDDLAGPRHIIRQLAILYIVAKKITQYPPEVLMSRVR